MYEIERSPVDKLSDVLKLLTWSNSFVSTADSTCFWKLYVTHCLPVVFTVCSHMGSSSTRYLMSYMVIEHILFNQILTNKIGKMIAPFPANPVYYYEGFLYDL